MINGAGFPVCVESTGLSQSGLALSRRSIRCKSARSVGEEANTGKDRSR
jgi:hypothetical protein